MRNDFAYSYKAEEKERLEELRKKYSPGTKIQTRKEEVESLDKRAEAAGTVAALAVGIAGTLIFGIAMCLGLVWQQMIVAVIIGLAGGGVIAAAYPLYKKQNRAKKAELAPQILRLLNEIERGEN